MSRGLLTAVFIILLNTSFTFANSIKASASDYIKVLEVLAISDIRSALWLASEHGLERSNYWTDSMESQYFANSKSPKLRQNAFWGYIRFLQDLNLGVVNPAYLGTGFDLRQKNFVTPDQLNALILVRGGDAVNLVDSFAPQNPAYRSLQEALKRISQMCDSESWTNLPASKKPLRLDSRDPLVLPAIKNRLAQLGYHISYFDDLFDRQTLDAIYDIQVNLKFKPDGVISPNGKTWKYLNVSCEDRAAQIKTDMEKLRWFPRDFGDRYIFVNIAHNYLYYKDKTSGTSFAMKTIVGRSARKTPTMIDQITYITINPFWVVPPTVFREDKVEDLKNLSSSGVRKYFEQNNYEVWDDKFRYKINPASINWSRATAKSGFYIRQKPGLHNALGVLKFNLTNDNAIYLHDTNQRQLFNEFNRHLSSGCVRVERPFEIAEALLKNTEWTYDKIQSVTASPGEIPKKNTNVKLKNPMPVYMVLQTSTLSSDGIMRFTEDIYDQANVINGQGQPYTDEVRSF